LLKEVVAAAATKRRNLLTNRIGRARHAATRSVTEKIIVLAQQLFGPLWLCQGQMACNSNGRSFSHAFGRRLEDLPDATQG
jgi:hypothetical protein